MGRRITILGMGQTGLERKHDILRYCEGTEIWGLNNGYAMYPVVHGHWARFFELHNWPYLRKWDPGCGITCHFTDLNLQECPVYSTIELPVIERPVLYDTLKICRHLDSNFFLGSPSLMLMLMLYEHDNGRPVEYVQSYGIDTEDEKHRQQRVSWAYWIREITRRKIMCGGTMCDFMLEPDNDKGLDPLRALVGREMMKDKEAESARLAEEAKAKKKAVTKKSKRKPSKKRGAKKKGRVK